jgi:SM-20-related protein
MAAMPKDRVSPPAARGVMPPYLVERDFLEEDSVAEFLQFALARESAFAPTKVAGGGKGRHDPGLRVSVGTQELGLFKLLLEAKISALIPELLVARLQVTPVPAPMIELLLVAHNEGAFYKRHIDTRTAADADSIRVLSGVYYFYAEPKAFAGGALRLYAIAAQGDAQFVDIEPLRNSLLVFPSWAPHEVMPVSCPSGRFIDSRFAVNCWVHRRKAAPP